MCRIKKSRHEMSFNDTNEKWMCCMPYRLKSMKRWIVKENYLIQIPCDLVPSFLTLLTRMPLFFASRLINKIRSHTLTLFVFYFNLGNSCVLLFRLLLIHLWEYFFTFFPISFSIFTHFSPHNTWKLHRLYYRIFVQFSFAIPFCQCCFLKLKKNWFAYNSYFIRPNFFLSPIFEPMGNTIMTKFIEYVQSRSLSDEL